MKHRNLCTLLIALTCACAGSPPELEGAAFVRAREATSSGPAEDTSARRAKAAAELEALLDASASGADAVPSFWASYYLAQLHTAATDEPFLTEPSTRREHLGSIHITPERRAELDEGLRFSRTAHLVAALDHAGRARNLLGEFSSPPAPPASLSGRGPLEGGLSAAPSSEALDTNLALMMATAYARLGFRREVSVALNAAPRLLEPDSCLAFMQEFEVRNELKPWVCEMVSNHLRAEDELLAYRFAILAIEGRTRFGHELPEEVAARLEAWILNGASVRFVCPRSQTSFIPGRERSPLSGVRHIEYVAVAR